MATSDAVPPHTNGERGQEQPEHGSNCLPIGTRLGEFEITRLIGEGGFGIVYAAKDHLLEREIAIKEYMPSALASRAHDAWVAVKSDRHAETFASGLHSFVNEAKLLAQFDHPSLVKVYRFWEGNGTAYMAMPLYRGDTLRHALKRLGGPPSEAWLRQLIVPMLDALDLIHSARCYHRDVAPDNILILESGRPVLLDFGAARRVIGDMTQALTVILKPGFAPVEQYANGPEMRQGPWTDIYAFAAVVYYCITGKAPIPAVARMMRDTMVPAREAGRGAYGEEFLAAIDHALAVRIEDRTQSIAQFREELGIEPDAAENFTIIKPQLARSLPDAGIAVHRSPSGVAQTPVAAPSHAPVAPPSPNQPPATPSAPAGAQTSHAHEPPPSQPISQPVSQPVSQPDPQPASAAIPRPVDAAPAGARPAPATAQSGLPAPRVDHSHSSPPAADAAHDDHFISASAADALQPTIRPEHRTASAPAASGPTRARRTSGTLLAAGAAVAVIAGVAVWLATRGADAPTPGAQADVAAQPVAQPSAAPASSQAATPSASQPAPGRVAPSSPASAPSAKESPSSAATSAASPGATTATPPSPASGTSSTPAAAPAPLPAFTPGGVLDAVYAGRDPDWGVDIRTDNSSVRIGKDQLKFRVRSARGGYLYLLMLGTDSTHFYVLFPNTLDGNNRLAAGAEVQLPRPGWSMVAGGPAGVNRFVAIVTPSPREFASAGLKRTTPFSEFDLASAARAYRNAGPDAFAGTPVGCREAADKCGAYGAARFEIREIP